ncbi:MAG: dihydroorotase [Raineya sp.]
MQYLIQSALIIDPNSPFHLQKKDITIENGIILKIADNIAVEEHMQVIASEHLCVNIGLMDLRSYVPDLGHEYKETLHTARKAAAAGGFTEICLLPNMSPALDSKDSLLYVQKDNTSQLVQTYPIAALSLQTKGEDLSEMIDLHHAGAVAFSDGLQCVHNTDILLKSLLYLQTFGGLLIQRPQEPILTRYGQMNEGVTATYLGFRGLPTLAEVLVIQRDLEILRYTGGKIHFSCISAQQSVELIRKAKQEGLAVSCDVAANNLFFTEEKLYDFDTNFKLNPPLRTEEDRQALWQGIGDDTIDAIVSDHQPQDTESKDLEFDLAAFGAIGLQTTLLAANTKKGSLPLEKILEKLCQNPRKIVQKDIPRIKEGEIANLCVWDTQKETIFTRNQILSKSKNSPFLGEKLQGKVLAVFNKLQELLF